MKTTAVLYLRVSTTDQANKNHSLPVQEKKLNDYCLLNDIPVAETFIERGESARTSERPEFQKMLAYCEKNKRLISHVIVSDLSRLARNILDQAQTLVSLKQWGIELISIDEPISDDTAAGKLSRNILGSMHQFFSDSLSEKTKFRMAAGVQQGKWLWKAPLGYLNEAGTKRIVLDPVRSGLVRKAFELIVEKDYTTAFTLIRSLGLTTKTGRSIPKQTFSRMVRNEFYAGVIRLTSATSGNVRIPGLHEALVTEEMFKTVQTKLRGKSAHQEDHEEFPFRGFILCGQCHKPLTAGMCRGRNQTYARYWCHRKGCTTAVSKVDSEALFCFGLEFIQPSMELVARLPEVAASMWTTRKDQIANESKILTHRLAEQNEINRKTILARVNGILSEEDFKVLKSSINEELARITKAIETLDAEKSSYVALMQEAKEDVIDLRAAWEKGSLHRKRELQWALFPEGLEWWAKKNVTFEPGKPLSIEDIPRVFESLSLVGVPDGI